MSSDRQLAFSSLEFVQGLNVTIDTNSEQAENEIQCAFTCMDKLEGNCAGFTFDSSVGICTSIVSLEYRQITEPNQLTSTPTEGLIYAPDYSSLCDFASGKFNWFSSGGEGVCAYLFEERHVYADAETLCEESGGQLFTVKTAEKLDILRQLALLTGLGNVGVGCDDLEAEGVWRWINGDLVDLGQFWVPQMPDNNLGTEHCGEYRLSQNGLNDLGCDAEMFYACEIDNSPVIELHI